MMREAERGAAEAAEDVEVWSFGGERERERGQRGLAVEPGASQARASQEVGNGFQSVKRILWGRVRECQLQRSLFYWRQKSKRVRNDGDFDRKSAEKFAVGLDVDFGLRRILRFGQVLADSFAGMGEIDARHLPMAAEDCAGYVGQISETTGGSAEYEANIIAIERCAGSEFPQHSPEMADADSEKFSEVGALRMVRTGFGELDLKLRHGIREPEMPGFRVVGGHAQAMFGSGVEFIEKVGVDSHTGGHDEVAGAGLSFEIVILNAAQGHAPRRSGESGPRGAGDIHGQAKIVGERVGGTHGKNCKRDVGSGEHLDNVVDGAIAAAAENGVTSG
jgi:hypothetical protein